MEELLARWQECEIGINLDPSAPHRLVKAKLLAVTGRYIAVQEPDTPAITHYFPYAAITQVTVSSQGLPVGGIFHKEPLPVVIRVARGTQTVVA